MDHVKCPFDAPEIEALAQLAERHLRSIPNEVRSIVRERLVAEGLLTTPRDERQLEPAGATR